MNEPLQLSHVQNNFPRMVDVTEKSDTMREAIAQTRLLLPTLITDALVDGELVTKKGPVFATAIIAGTMAVKQTSTLIPLCHALPIGSVHVVVEVEKPGAIVITCAVKSYGKTGVEMEALTGASVAALTIYDMCKALSFDMTIAETKLLKKSGGTHDRFVVEK